MRSGTRDAQRRGQTISEETLRLADWTILITDAPTKHLSFEEALVLLRERWQMELLYKLWKQDGLVDEWRTANRWRVLCELYAKLIGLLLQHWLIVLFAWQDAQRSLVKLAQVVRDSGWSIMEALAGERSLASALRLIARRMRSGCHMNTRRKHPNSAQLLARGTVEWPLSWCEYAKLWDLPGHLAACQPAPRGHVRVIEYRLHPQLTQDLGQFPTSRNAREADPSQVHRRLSTLLDPVQAPALDLIICYHERLSRSRI